MSYKACRIQVGPAYTQPGPHRIFDLLFIGGLSCGCPDEATIAQLDACGVPYQRIPYQDADDIAEIDQLRATLAEKDSQINELVERLAQTVNEKKG